MHADKQTSFPDGSLLWRHCWGRAKGMAEGASHAEPGSDPTAGRGWLTHRPHLHFVHHRNLKYVVLRTSCYFYNICMYFHFHIHVLKMSIFSLGFIIQMDFKK